MISIKMLLLQSKLRQKKHIKELSFGILRVKLKIVGLGIREDF